MTIDYASIGLRIHHQRIQAKISQDKLAEMANISRSFLSHLESGTTSVGIESIISIANALKVPIDELLTDNLKASNSLHDTDDYYFLLDCTPEETDILIKSMKSLKNILRNYKIKK